MEVYYKKNFHFEKNGNILYYAFEMNNSIALVRCPLLPGHLASALCLSTSVHHRHFAMAAASQHAKPLVLVIIDAGCPGPRVYCGRVPDASGVSSTKASDDDTRQWGRRRVK